MNVDQPIAVTLEFAKEHYGARPSIHGKTLVQHAVSVAKTAETIAHKVYQDVRKELVSEETRESVAIIVHSALLHDVINVSRCAFEQIAEQTTVQIAATVADLSRDFRLVETKRDMEFRGRLSASGVRTQIVAVADILCTTAEVIEMIKHLGLDSSAKARKMLMQLDGDLLAITAASRYYALRLYTHAARNLLHDASQLLKEAKAQARLARQVAHATSGLRTRIAAKMRSEKNQKKEQSSGKKRTRRRDP